jgi:hypothetical protein
MNHIKLYESFINSRTGSIDENYLLKDPGNGIVNGFNCKKLYELSEDQRYKSTKYLDDALTGKKVTVEGKEYDILEVNIGGCPGGRYETPCNSFIILINKPMPKNGIFSAQKNSTVFILNNGKVLLETAIGADYKLIPTNKSLTEIFKLGKKFFDRFKA